MVTGLKYNEGKGFNKPGAGNLFLVADVSVRNTGGTEITFDWQEGIVITGPGAEYRMDKIRNGRAIRDRVIKNGETKSHTLTFAIPEKLYRDGALASVRHGGKRAVINLGYVDAFDGHRALAFRHLRKEAWGDALAEYRTALSRVNKDDHKEYGLVLYEIGALYLRWFADREDMEVFKKAEDRGEGTGIFAD